MQKPEGDIIRSCRNTNTNTLEKNVGCLYTPTYDNNLKSVDLKRYIN